MMMLIRAIKPFRDLSGRPVAPGALLDVPEQRARELERARVACIITETSIERVTPERRAGTGPTHTTAARPRHRGEQNGNKPDNAR